MTFFRCTRPFGECSSRFVITAQPTSIAAFTVVLFARSPFSKNAARKVQSTRWLNTAVSDRYPMKYTWPLKIDCSSSKRTTNESSKLVFSWSAVDT